MNKSIDNTIKYYVSPQGSVIFVCTHCDANRHINAEAFRKKKHTIKLRCTCGTVFTIDLDFRENYRKQVDIPAVIHGATEGLDHPMPCTVTDLSMDGVAFRINQPFDIQQEDQLQITFQLDNKRKAEVNRTIEIVHLGPDNVLGGRFIDTVIESEEKALYYYLLNA